MEEAVAIDDVIQKNFSQLQKPGVLRDRVPKKVGPFPTDVRQASPMHMLRASNPDLWAEVADAALPRRSHTAASGRDNGRVARQAGAARRGNLEFESGPQRNVRFRLNRRIA